MDQSLGELRWLARLHGVYSSYRGHDGQINHVPEATLRKVLAALGVDPDKTFLEARAQRLKADWESPLSAVIFQKGPTNCLKFWLTLPEDVSLAELSCEIELESGKSVLLGELDCTAAREIRSKELDAVTYHRYRVSISTDLALGYHKLVLKLASGGHVFASAPCICFPPHCYLPECLLGEKKVWGVSAQVYSLTSNSNWGVGELSELEGLTTLLGNQGASFLGLSPLHALSLSRPSSYSPYSPTSRIWFNPLFLDADKVAARIGCDDFEEFASRNGLQERAAIERANRYIDYSEVAALKHSALSFLFNHFKSKHLQKKSELSKQFYEFVARSGKQLERYSSFEALSASLKSVGQDAPAWQDWPEQYRTPSSTSVDTFNTTNSTRLLYYQFLQWSLDCGLSELHDHASQQGLSLGLYFDLAVGSDRGGADVWGNQDAYAVSANVGAPPDAYNHLGQDWGFCPMIPDALRRQAYEPLRQVLRANMKHAGALRIDHAMALMRLYWIPFDTPAHLGTYVSYPINEMLAVLALESSRNRCMIIGEDLGVVPDAFRAAMLKWQIFSYRVFLFMKYGAGNFVPKHEYPQNSVVTTTTHDLPTAWLFWSGGDLDLKRQFNLFLEDSQEEHLSWERIHDRRGILHILGEAGYDLGGANEETLTEEALVAMYQYLWHSPAKILAIPLEELSGLAEQPNLPGIPFDYPSWRVRTRISVEQLPELRMWSLVRAALELR